MNESLDFDKKAKTTTIGPHRDDIAFMINGMEVSIYGSQGQQRSTALALKLGLAEYIKKESDKLIVILDDVFGELDSIRQKQLINMVDNETQVFITTISSGDIDQTILMKSNIIKLEEKVTKND